MVYIVKMLMILIGFVVEKNKIRIRKYFDWIKKNDLYIFH